MATPEGASARRIRFEDLILGEKAELEWQVQDSDIDDFARLSGDRNPLHMNADFARAKGFRDRVAHGFLLGSKVSALVGMFLPGEDCLILEQSLAYPKPIFPGDRIVVAGEVDQLSVENRMVRVRIRAHNVAGERPLLVARGMVLCRSQ